MACIGLRPFSNRVREHLDRLGGLSRRLFIMPASSGQPENGRTGSHSGRVCLPRDDPAADFFSFLMFALYYFILARLPVPGA